ncbi:hypothetical protein D9619_005086 [Psilocybe cf. subviscida]|uniref:Uncharacterized protein n=1 Tax=Psilocybe cf. subviscida TaxID=2480587 RepID=A0A8H5F848_9AGAR|nr:hypothetical protein D9619_005086 [Psilocybe cf. subviscida]
MPGLAEKFPGSVTTLKYVAGDIEVNNTIAELLKTRHGRVDVVIANAGIHPSTCQDAITPIADMRDMFEVLFPLLKASPAAKFVPITSIGGSLTHGIENNFGLAGYGASKAALNSISRRIHFENDWIRVGDTDMLTQFCNRDPTGAIGKFVQQVQKSPFETAKPLATVIENANRTSHGGEFLNFDDTKLPW